METVKIHGRDYETVASRKERFREIHPDWSILTQIIEKTKDEVTMKATITDPEGKVIANGHSTTKYVDKDCALEDAETSAVGRALGFAMSGFGGNPNIATADEMKKKDFYQNRQPKKQQQKPTSQQMYSAAIKTGAKEEAKKYTEEEKFAWYKKNTKWMSDEFPYEIDSPAEDGELGSKGEKITWIQLPTFKRITSKAGNHLHYRGYLKCFVNSKDKEQESKQPKNFKTKCAVACEIFKEQEDAHKKDLVVE